MRNLLSMVFFLTCVFSGQTAAASCVTIALLDESGAIIKPDGLVVGFKVGDTPIFPTPIPAHVSQREVGPITCSHEIIRPMRGLYDLSCRTDQAMRQTAENNRQQYLVVRQQCSALNAALVSAGG